MEAPAIAAPFPSRTEPSIAELPDSDCALTGVRNEAAIRPRATKISKTLLRMRRVSIFIFDLQWFFRLKSDELERHRDRFKWTAPLEEIDPANPILID